jgi:hypothetical protein
MSDEQEPHRECWHIKNTKARAITIIRHFGIAGASRGADDLDTTTRLCAKCSGTFAALLQKAEDVE